MPLILPGNVASATAAGYEVANSCRFNRGDSPGLTLTQSSPTDNNKWTFSCWFKVGALTTAEGWFFLAYSNSTNMSALRLNGSGDSHTLNFWDYQSSYTGRLVTNRSFRDPTSWYHVVCVWDSDNGTAGNRMRMYVNGTEETSFSTDTNPSSGQSTIMNTSSQGLEIGRSNAESAYFDGYMAEVCFVDGQALAASDFGEFDEDSPMIWKPKDVSGLTFGNNGFYLDFEDSSNLGNDANGGGDFTEVNIAATDSATDTPTNNFATFNPLAQPSSDLTFSEGNTKMTVAHASGSHHIAAFSTIAVTAGKWYVEGKCTETNDTKWTHGIANVEFMYNKTGTTNWIPGKESLSQNDTIGMYLNDIYKNGSETVSALFSADFADGDIVMMAIDCDNGKMWYGLNGTWNNGSSTDSTTFNASSHDETFTTGDDYVVHFVAEDTAWLANFGNPAYANSSSAADENGYGDFEYAPPSGFLAICTKNLGESGG